jgi:hypothetical protein
MKKSKILNRAYFVLLLLSKAKIHVCNNKKGFFAFMECKLLGVLFVSFEFLIVSHHSGIKVAWFHLKYRRAMSINNRVGAEYYLKEIINKYFSMKDSPYIDLVRHYGYGDVNDILYDEFIDKTTICYKELTKFSCYQIYQYFKLFGDIRIADKLKNRLRDALIFEQELCSYVIPDALSVMLENDLGLKVIHLLSKKDTSTLQSTHLIEIKAYAYLLMGNLEKSKQLWDRVVCDADKQFKKLISGKSIAIVGPKTMNDKVIQEVNSFDIVIHINYLKNNQNNKVHGLCADISYYNNASWDIASNDVEVFSLLNWVVVKDETGKCDRLERGLNIQCRKSFSANLMLLEWIPGLIQVILYDLIRFNPLSIKLFSADFYFDGFNYREKYQIISADIDDRLYWLRLHDLVSNFDFVQKMYRLGLFKADNRAREILLLDKVEYLKKVYPLA